MNKIDQLKETAETIKTNELPQSNTALLVGKHLQMINEVLESILTDLNNKVPSENGKGLSTNDFTNAYKTTLDTLNTELSKYVQKETGKGLSTNDFTNAYKTALDTLKTELSKYVQKETGKGLSTNDYTDEEKDKLSELEQKVNNFSGADPEQISNAVNAYLEKNPIEGSGEMNVQSDWNQNNTSADDYIKNKPTIPSIEGLATEDFVNKALSEIPSGGGGDWEIVATFNNSEDEVNSVDITFSKPCKEFVIIPKIADGSLHHTTSSFPISENSSIDIIPYDSNGAFIASGGTRSFAYNGVNSSRYSPLTMSVDNVFVVATTATLLQSGGYNLSALSYYRTYVNQSSEKKISKIFMNTRTKTVYFTNPCTIYIWGR